MTALRLIHHEKFDELATTLQGAGFVDDLERFMVDGARFVVDGQVTTIRPLGFNGLNWKVEIKQINRALN